MAALNGHGVWMAAPNYDQGSCCIYEGWRFGSVKRKIRCWRTEAGEDFRVSDVGEIHSAEEWRAC
jgi:hypothetical protein